MRGADHDAKFWAWKYERREAECEELAEEIRNLWAVLKPFAALADEADRFRHSDDSTCEWRLKAGDLRQARAALNRSESPPPIKGSVEG